MDVLLPDGRLVQNIDLSNGATQATLFLSPANYILRLRFVDDSGRRELTPATEMPLQVVGQERF